MPTRSVARDVDPMPEPATPETAEPITTRRLADAFYAALRALGCVKCEACGGAYMPRDHTTHHRPFDPWTGEAQRAERARRRVEAPPEVRDPDTTTPAGTESLAGPIVELRVVHVDSTTSVAAGVEPERTDQENTNQETTPATRRHEHRGRCRAGRPCFQGKGGA